MAKYSISAASTSIASALTSPPSAATATLRSSYGSGGGSNNRGIHCRSSTSTSSTCLPPAASAIASAAATVVLPVPPLPVTMCSRARRAATGHADASLGAAIGSAYWRLWEATGRFRSVERVGHEQPDEGHRHRDQADPPRGEKRQQKR